MTTAVIAALLMLILGLTACNTPQATHTRDPAPPPPAETSPPNTRSYSPPATPPPTEIPRTAPDSHAVPRPKAPAGHGSATRTPTAAAVISTPPAPRPEDPLLAALTKPELACLDLAGMPPNHLLHNESNPAPALACLSAPNVDLLMARLVTLNHPAMAPEAARCFSQLKLGETAKAFPSPPEAQATPFLLMAGASYALANCLSKERWTALGYSRQQHRLYACIFSQGVTIAELLEAVFSGKDDIANRVEDNAAACEPPPESPEPADGNAQQHPRFPAAAEVARRHTGSPEAASLISIREHIWNNGAMGCPQPGQVYTEALVDSYIVQIGLGPQTVRVHSNRRGTIMFVPTNCLGGPTP